MISGSGSLNADMLRSVPTGTHRLSIMGDKKVAGARLTRPLLLLCWHAEQANEPAGAVVQASAAEPRVRGAALLTC